MQQSGMTNRNVARSPPPVRHDLPKPTTCRCPLRRRHAARQTRGCAEGTEQSRSCGRTADLFGEDQLVVLGVAKTIFLIAMPDDQLAPALQQFAAVDLLPPGLRHQRDGASSEGTGRNCLDDVAHGEGLDKVVMQSGMG